MSTEQRGSVVERWLSIREVLGSITLTEVFALVTPGIIGTSRLPFTILSATVSQPLYKELGPALDKDASSRSYSCIPHLNSPFHYENPHMVHIQKGLVATFPLVSRARPGMSSLTQA